ncbi:MAG TPA: pyridoxal-phosphate dependent enzyme [Thermoanaerobaculia bacterium]|nr:pyridoxal-phosphate dependent enzyme [Thermoanaerobaculia bacterium]
MDLPSPLERAPAEIGNGLDVWWKREDAHELGAFKWRGALPTVAAYQERGATAVVTASTGNHGAAVAWSSRRLGLRAMVYAPAGASLAKLALIDGLGAEIRIAGTDLDFAKDEGKRFAAEASLPFFEDGVEPTQYEGYGAIADEIVDGMAEPPSAVVVPVGNGALIGGVGRALQRRSPGTLVIGVVAKEAPVMALSWEAGRAVECARMATFADGLAVRVAIPEAVALLDRVVDRMVPVSERSIARAMGVCARTGIRVEPAAAAGLAAVGEISSLEGPIVAIVTGRNVDDEVWRRAVENPDAFPG